MLATKSAVFAALFTIIWSSVAGSPTDPRCASYTCQIPTAHDLSRATDPSTCIGESCPRCLTGPVWEARLRDDLGLGSAPRSMTPTIQVSNWLSAEIVETLTRMLLEETMGFDAKPFAAPASGYDLLCCAEHLMMMETWPLRPMPEDDGYFSIARVPIGYEGQSGLFVPQRTLDRYPLATAYNAYKYLADYGTIFPAGYSTACNDTIKDQALGCVAGNYVCDDERWANTSCASQGRYVPPQCAADPASCQEIWLASPTWDAGFFEGLIKNTGLKFVIVYLGGSNLQSRVRRWNAEQKDFAFYWWQPDPMVSAVGGTPIAFNAPSLECIQGQTNDPATSRGDCDYVKSPLMKVMRRSSLALDADLKHFFDSFSFNSAQISALMREHPEGGGTRNVWNVSCDWLQNNYGTWKDWVRNTPSGGAASQTTDSGNSATVMGAAIGGSVGGLVILLVLGYLYLRHQAAVATKNAPKTTPFALVFTDIESSTALWERYGDDMRSAVELHHAIVRELIEEHQCYEVKTIGDAFMIAAPTALDALLLSLAIQKQLNEAEWPTSLVAWNVDLSMNGSVSELYNSDKRRKSRSLAYSGEAAPFRGLRVRMGLHYCTDAEAKFDITTKRFDYYGPDVNTSARIQSVAAGGQILLSEGTLAQLETEEGFSTVNDNLCLIEKFASGVTMKGVSEAAVLYSVLPSELAGRFFDPIPGTVDETVKIMAGENASTNGSYIGSSKKESATFRVLQNVFTTVPKELKADRDLFLTSLLKQRRCATRGTLTMRLVRLAQDIDNGFDMNRSTTSRTEASVTFEGKGDSLHAPNDDHPEPAEIGAPEQQPSTAAATDM